jgi:hypothetical protein
MRAGILFLTMAVAVGTAALPATSTADEQRASWLEARTPDFSPGAEVVTRLSAATTREIGGSQVVEAGFKKKWNSFKKGVSNRLGTREKGQGKHKTANLQTPGGQARLNSFLGAGGQRQNRFARPVPSGTGRVSHSGSRVRVHSPKKHQIGGTKGTTRRHHSI